MATIRCEGCQTAFESTLPVCLCCGRCPGCGTIRLQFERRAPQCSQCGVEHCIGCGRCHKCGAPFETELPACSCGHPHDEEKLRIIEKSFAFAPVRGCLEWSAAALLLMFSAAGLVLYKLFT
jgi:hypothetical protein